MNKFDNIKHKAGKVEFIINYYNFIRIHYYYLKTTQNPQWIIFKNTCIEKLQELIYTDSTYSQIFNMYLDWFLSHK
jgi:hypothetical protein